MLMFSSQTGNDENPQISYVINEKASFPGKEDEIKEVRSNSEISFSSFDNSSNLSTKQ